VYRRVPQNDRVTRGQDRSHRALAPLALGALGVVYGDIGTSPLYAVRECFNPLHGMEPDPKHIFGILSMIFWSLILVISVKYLAVVLQADNRGEGGILALLALVRPESRERPSRLGSLMVMAGLFGAALLYGDGMLTPAVTVISAMEGLVVSARPLAPYVLPITLVILFFLFFF